jgi:hypothetical protein
VYTAVGALRANRQERSGGSGPASQSSSGRRSTWMRQKSGRSCSTLSAVNQGLTFVHFAAQRKRFLWDRGCM